MAGAASAWCRQGAIYVMLYVHLSNPGARAFYEALGCRVSDISPPADDAAGVDFEIRELALS